MREREREIPAVLEGIEECLEIEIVSSFFGRWLGLCERVVRCVVFTGL